MVSCWPGVLVCAHNSVPGCGSYDVTILPTESMTSTTPSSLYSTEELAQLSTILKTLAERSAADQTDEAGYTGNIVGEKHASL